MHRRQRPQEGVLIDQENAGMLGRTPGVSRGILSAKMDSNSLAFKTPNPRLADTKAMNTAMAAPINKRRLLGDITNATPYVQTVEKSSHLPSARSQVNMRRQSGQYLPNTRSTTTPTATSTMSTVTIVDTTIDENIEYMPPRSSELPFKAELPLNWHRLTGPDNPQSCHFRRDNNSSSMSLNDWSLSRVPETLRTPFRLKDKGLFYQNNRHLLVDIEPLVINDDELSLSNLLHPIEFPIPDSYTKRLLPSTVYAANDRRSSFGKPQINNQQAGRSRRHGSSYSNQSGYSRIAFSASKRSSRTQRFPSRLPVLSKLKARHDVQPSLLYDHKPYTGYRSTTTTVTSSNYDNLDHSSRSRIPRYHNLTASALNAMHSKDTTSSKRYQR
ncbi:hypothetical protein BDF19DRAFT_440958 [Syncephalis fuscata]|nr:hypothetical protein BDF19DRAFT_440958 [Syncephalis fuscata]